MTAIAIDVSQYSGEITKSKFAAAKAGGVSRVIVALNNLDLARRQLEAASSVGLEVQAYIYLYFAQDVVARVRSCLGVVGGTGVKHVWLDCEDERHTLNAEQLASRIQDARQATVAAGYTAGIYTANWWWSKHMPGVTRFKSEPLWDAFWDGAPDVDAPRYGGWTRAAMSQYRADTTYAGIWCDLNAYEDVPVIHETTPRTSPPSGPMSPPLDLNDLYLSGTKAFIPAFDYPWDVEFKALPERDGVHVYELTRRKR